MAHLLRKDALEDCFFDDVELIVTALVGLQVLRVMIGLQLVDILLLSFCDPILITCYCSC